MISDKYSKRYCADDISQIENYHLAVNDTENIWDIHHRLQDLGISSDELKAQNRYWKVPADELIFLLHSKHMKRHGVFAALNKSRKGLPLAEKTKALIGVKSADNWKNPAYIAKMTVIHNSEEYRNRQSVSHKGKKLSAEARKNISLATKGENNPMYGHRHSEKTRKLLSLKAKLRCQQMQLLKQLVDLACITKIY